MKIYLSSWFTKYLNINIAQKLIFHYLEPFDAASTLFAKLYKTINLVTLSTRDIIATKNFKHLGNIENSYEAKRNCVYDYTITTTRIFPDQGQCKTMFQYFQ